MINRARTDEGFVLAEERERPDEEDQLHSIIESFTAQMRGLWNPGHFERGGNTKIHGVVRAEFTVRDAVGTHAARHLRAAAHVHAWVCFSGPGPYDPGVAGQVTQCY